MCSSCKAGLSQQCKPIVAVLMYLHDTDIDELDFVSCTDKKCLWSAPHAKCLEQYSSVPLDEHACFKHKFLKQYNMETTDEQRQLMKNIVLSNPDSALTKHM